MKRVDRDAETLVPCPLCERCSMCRGTRRVTCRVCPRPHTVDCPACEVCGLCRGTQLVSQADRHAWLTSNSDPEPPSAA